MSQVQKFQFGLMDLRVVDIEGQPWFVLKELCAVLGLKAHANGGHGPQKRLLGADEHRLIQKTHHSEWWMLFEGNASRHTLVSESGLYKLVMRSNKPEAKAFQDWVTRVVLPAIRKDGSYVLGEEKVATGEMDEDELVLRAMQAQQKKVERLPLERDRLAAHNVLLAKEKMHLEDYNQRLLPAAEVGQAVAKRKSLGVVDFCRKLPGVSVNAVQTRLFDLQYFHKKHGHWSVYAKFKGVLFDETFSPEGYSKVIVLEAGQRKLVELYHNGLLPMLKGKTPIKHLELDV